MVACWAHNPKVSGSKPLLARSENDLKLNTADVAQSVERKPFKLVAVGSSPTEGKSENDFKLIRSCSSVGRALVL